MEKKKVTLETLRIHSSVTELEEEQMDQLRGGFYRFIGRRYSYRTRWTSVDTRVDEQRFSGPSMPGRTAD